ncbi:MAG: ATP-dependent 6-phosphofructokinase [bacterium]|nr:ATP-dependent 6-phosphofructokinase [bacterium]
MDVTIKKLGEPGIGSPLLKKLFHKSAFVQDKTRMRYDILIDDDHSDEETADVSFELAGPREKIYFDPAETNAAIVTCGGLCPGLNDVIRSIVMESYYMYGVKSITGITYGYNGLNPAKGFEPIELTPELVRDIHKQGGTMLGSSRGGTDDMNILVDTLVRLKINILYAIGGDGTLRGAQKLAEIALERGLNLSVIGIPKTIDNDISYIQRSFGFESAFTKAVESISGAHVEAEGAPNGIGLVKLMGRHSGFIAGNAALAMNDVNFVLVPEVPFKLHGENGFLAHLEARIKKRGHAVICVAEGAGQDILIEDESAQQKDASGNVKLEDIGIFLKNAIKKHFKERNIEANLKYIDPSYIIRSTPANPNDSIFCALLGQYAVHAGMAGKTNLVIGLWNNMYTHLPIELAVSKRKIIDPESRFWYNVIEATGQPMNMV